MNTWLHKIASPEIISRAQFEDMMNRVFQRVKQFLRDENIFTWRQWIEEQDSYTVALSVEGDFDIHDRYLKNLPEGVFAIHLIEMYRQGVLPEVEPERYRYQRGPTEPHDVGPRVLPWQPQNPAEMSPDEAQQAYAVATQRMTPRSKDEVTDARKSIYLAFNSDPALAEKLGIPPVELRRRIRTYSGLTVQRKQMEDSLNQGIPEEHQWTGMTNSSFIGRQRVDHNDLESFVKNVDVTNEGRGFYNSGSGEYLRQCVMNTFLSIDTRISYDDLSFIIGRCSKPTTRGLYSHNQRLITIAEVHQHTVSHEIGHYLDYKWGEGFGFGESLASNPSVNSKNLARIERGTPIEQLQWAEKYYAFVQNLMDKSDISSEYMQSNREVFARFVDNFVRWTDPYDHRGDFGTAVHYFDSFEESDYRVFVQLLQEKSYLDAKFPLTPQQPQRATG